MRNEVIVRFAEGEEVTLHATEAMSHEAARAWLDQEFVRLECVPARASGKVLFADKLLAIAQAADPQGFADPSWAASFAAAAAGALGKAFIRVDVADASVGY